MLYILIAVACAIAGAVWIVFIIAMSALPYAFAALIFYFVLHWMGVW
jgi:hypothetical protein